MVGCTGGAGLELDERLQGAARRVRRKLSAGAQISYPLVMGLFKRRGSKPPPDATAEILGRHLTRDFIAYPMAEQVASADEVHAVGRRLGLPVLPDVLSHLTGEFPGVYVEAKEAVWPRAKAYEVGPFWTFLHGVHTFTAATGSNDWMRAEHVANELRAATGLAIFPVLKVVGDADIYGVDERGRLVQFDHELDELEPLEDLTFFGLFEREIAALVERTARMKAERAGRS